MRNRRSVSIIVIVAAAFLGVAGHAAASGAEPAGLSVSDSRLAAPTPDLADVWALSIGINNYTNAPSLEVAVNDARTVDRQLNGHGIPQDHRIRLLDQDATATNIRAALDWLATHVQDGDNAIVFVASHATTDGANRQAIRTTDGHQITDVELAQRLSPINAPIWLIMATCYSGGFDEALTANRTLTASSPIDKITYENLDLEHSYLVDYLFNRVLANADPARLDPGPAFAAAVAELERDHPDRLPTQNGPGVPIMTSG